MDKWSFSGHAFAGLMAITITNSLQKVYVPLGVRG